MTGHKGRTHYSKEECDQIRALYRSGHSWRDIGKMMGRNHQVLSRKFGKEFRRSLSEAMKLAWANHGGPGPRDLSYEEMRFYRKIRWVNPDMSRTEAVRTIVEMRLGDGLVA